MKDWMPKKKNKKSAQNMDYNAWYIDECTTFSGAMICASVINICKIIGPAN